ncbi:MAG: MerR family DNA-binding protein [Gemmatimonadota bacterium]|nr:MerR family DNA-binding protein [Gemmatimonadota bacterium]
MRETEELLALSGDPGATSAEVRARAREKVADLEARSRDLAVIRDQLAALAESCDGEGAVSRCSILKAIGSERVVSASLEERESAREPFLVSVGTRSG